MVSAAQAARLFLFPDAFQRQVQKGLQALLIEGQALPDEGFPGFAHHEDGYGEHWTHPGAGFMALFH